jgi:thiosulfate/3-mercaptopyruvate sulfurtransferase
LVILDVRADVRSFTQEPRFYKDKKTGKPVLAAVGGHIPGAVLVPYKDIRTKRKVGDLEVDKMIPAKADFEKLIRASGVNRDSAVVVVTQGESDGDVTIATRMYWQLKYYGHDNLAILDGGMAQWLTEGREVSVAMSRPAPGDWSATAERSELFASSEDVAAAAGDPSSQLMDNRPISQYLGTARKPYVFAAGHIPSAKHFPTELITEAGAPAKFLPTEELRQLARAMGLDEAKPTISYCNSGHLASGGWFVMHELLGNKDVKLYDGSMHEWTLEQRPVTRMKME